MFTWQDVGDCNWRICHIFCSNFTSFCVHQKANAVFRDENVDTYFRGNLVFLEIYLFDSPEVCFMSLDLPWGLVCYFYTSSNRQSRKRGQGRAEQYCWMLITKPKLQRVPQWFLFCRIRRQQVNSIFKLPKELAHPVVIEETSWGRVVGDPAVKEVPRNAPSVRVASLLSDFFKRSVSNVIVITFVDAYKLNFTYCHFIDNKVNEEWPTMRQEWRERPLILLWLGPSLRAHSCV